MAAFFCNEIQLMQSCEQPSQSHIAHGIWVCLVWDMGVSSLVYGCIKFGICHVIKEPNSHCGTSRVSVLGPLISQ